MSESSNTPLRLDSASSIPLYRQLASLLRDGIENGEYTHDSQIPTESSLSQKYGISRITVRKALEELTDEGYLVRKQGKGTFVSIDRSIQNNYPFMPFDESVKLAHKIPSTKLLSYSLEIPSRRIANFLSLDANENSIVIKRLRYADNVPIILETDYYLNSFDFLASESLTSSNSEILRSRNILPVHGTNSISICYASEEESLLLNVEVDSPLLYVYSEIRDQNQRPIQVSKQIIRSELYKLILTS